jgi:hypothetical protein
MTQLLARGVVRTFCLTNEPGGLGLSCTFAGVSLAGVPLLRRTRAGFVPRPTSEITSLLRAAYGEDPTGLQSRLAAIAQALNGGDFTSAIIAAVHTRTPELSPEAALRLAKADGELTKYNFNPDELRDWHGRWTRDGAAGPESVAASGIESDQRSHPQVSADYAMGDDIMRGIVKNACIAECSESSLPTYNFGWKFFNCVNDCMRRHGYDPFVIRP